MCQLSQVANFFTLHAFVSPTSGKSIRVSTRSLASENRPQAIVLHGLNNHNILTISDRIRTCSGTTNIHSRMAVVSGRFAVLPSSAKLARQFGNTVSASVSPTHQ